MNGRVLTEEEIQEIAKWPDERTLLPEPIGVVIPSLIATIRDRDKTIAELRDNHEMLEGIWRHQQYLDGMRQEQNTIMREALEFYANKKTYELGVKISMGTSHPQHEPIKYDKGDIAREALAKVGESK